jgi:DNA-nicking Smr family endonuclease
MEMGGKKALNDVDYNFKILEQDIEKYAQELNKHKLRQDELKILKMENAQVKKDYVKIIVTDQQLSDANSELEYTQSERDEGNLKKINNGKTKRDCKG